MSLDYNLTEVNRELWPDGGVPLFNFCVMMMLCGVGDLKDDKKVETLRFRSFLLDRVRPDWGWKEEGLFELIPLMKGIRTNVSTYNDGKFMKEVIRLGKDGYDTLKRYEARKNFEEKEAVPSELIDSPAVTVDPSFRVT